MREPKENLEKLFAFLANEPRITDVLIDGDRRHMCRYDGAFEELSKHIGVRISIKDFIKMLSDREVSSFKRDKSLDKGFEFENIRYRAHFYFKMGKPSLVLRRLAETPPSMEDLGFSLEFCRKIFSRKEGIVFVAGPTGSGKTTTLAAAILFLAERPYHIITIEDPIEYRFSDTVAFMSQREVGKDCVSFSSALRDAMRANPNVILVGEVRDEETAEIALQAAETGHLVLTTIHASNLVETLQRILNLFPSEKRHWIKAQLQASLAGIVVQRVISLDPNQPATQNLLSPFAKSFNPRPRAGGDFEGL